MGNYAMNDFAITLRYHDYAIDDASGAEVEDGRLSRLHQAIPLPKTYGWYLNTEWVNKMG